MNDYNLPNTPEIDRLYPPSPINLTTPPPASPPGQDPAPPPSTPPTNTPANTDIRFFQNNVNRSNTLTHALLNSMCGKYEVILIQEPWRGRIGTARDDQNPNGSEIFGEPQQRNWLQFIPVPSDVGRDSPSRVSVYVSKHVPLLRVSQRTDLIEHPDILALQFSLGNKELLVINVYNDSSGSALEVLTNAALPDVPTIITGDFNLHHALWSRDDNPPPSTGRAEDFITWTETKRLNLLNQRGEATFFRPGVSSVLDLTWANDRALQNDAILDWQVRNDLLSGSDHVPISWTSSFGGPSPSSFPAQEAPFLFKEDQKDAWIKALTTALDRSLPDTEHLAETAEDLDRAITCITSAMVEASKNVSQRPASRPKASPWFSKKVSDSLTRVRDSRVPLPSPDDPTSPPPLPNPDDIRRHRDAVNELRREIRKAKKDWAMNFAGSVRTQDVWKLTSWYKGIRRHRSPPLTRPDGTRATETADKFDLFFTSFFPPPPSLDITPIPDHPPDRPDTRPFHPITRQEVDNALKQTSNLSAPGISGISYRALKWAWHVYSDLFIWVFNTALKLGTHHPLWKVATVIVIPKPNKPSYSTPRTFHPIQLLECMGKVLEKIIATRLMFDIGKHNLVPFNQFGGRTHSSCVDAGISLAHDVEAGWKKHLVGSAVAVDIKGFFDNVNHDRLTKVIHEMGFPHQITRWVRSFLSDRKAAIRLDDEMSDTRDLDIGIPQGSPCSPVLSIIYAAEVLSDLQEADIRTSAGIPVDPKGYIDDMMLQAFSKSATDNITSLTAALEIIIASLAKIGMVIDPDKTELIHFSRDPANNNERAHLLFSVAGKALRIIPKKTMRWLGIFFDRKLTFKDHVSIMTNRARSIVNGLRCLSNTIRGLSQANMRTLFRTCVIPVLTYGSPIWFRPDRPQKTLVDKLQTCQNHALRLIAGAFKTTPCRALAVLCHIPPIKLTLVKLSKGYANRISRLPDRSPVVARLPGEWKAKRSNTSPTPFRSPHSLKNTVPKKNTTAQFISTLSSHKSENRLPFITDNAPHTFTVHDIPQLTISPMPCDKEERPKEAEYLNDELTHSADNPRLLLIYCDGSAIRKGRQSKAGYGLTGYYRGQTIFSISMGLGPKATAFDGEMYALAHTACRIQDSLACHPEITAVKIYSDCSSALSRIFDPSPHPAQVASLLFRKKIKELSEVSPNIHVWATWNPGHEGVIGNDVADSLAKSGTELRKLIHSTAAFRKQDAKEEVLANWKQEIEDDPLGGEFGDLKIPITTTPSETFLTVDKGIYGRIVQAATGHGYLGSYYERFSIDAPTFCPCTDDTVQTRFHVLFMCPKHTKARHHLDDLTLTDVFNFKKGNVSLVLFLKNSSAFKKSNYSQADAVPYKPP